MYDENWLKALNEELSRQNMPPEQRPFEALLKLSQDKGISLPFNSPEALKIFEWFEKNTKSDTHDIGTFYESCCFYDTIFWRVVVPIGDGSFQLNALDALPEMPEMVKESLVSNPSMMLNYILFWTDCVDFGYGYADMTQHNREETSGLKFLRASYRELQSAKSILLEQKSDQCALKSSRSATEMILKSFVAMKEGLSENQDKELGHNLQKCFQRFVRVAGDNENFRLRPLTLLFPKIHERYEEESHNPQDLWLTFGFAQSLAAFLTREFTNRNTQSKILPTHRSMDEST